MNNQPVAIVTGAARGIGRACAVALVAAGFDILLNDREASDALTATAAELGAAAFAADVADLQQHQRIVDAAFDRWGRADCLVNNAGVGVMQRGDLLDVTPESFDRCVAVNTRAVFFLSQAFARHLIANAPADTHHRSIINITSSNAVSVSISRGEYCVSKAASSMTTKLFGLRLAESGIGVYEVRPGVIDTDMTRPAKAHYDQAIADGLVPAKRWGTPEDVAATVVAMATGKLRYTVGQAIGVDGGLMMSRF